MVIGSVIGQHDDERCGAHGFQISQQLEPIFGPQMQVEDDDPGHVLRKHLACLGKAARFMHRTDPGHVYEQRSQARTNRGGIVDDENIHPSFVSNSWQRGYQTQLPTAVGTGAPSGQCSSYTDPRVGGRGDSPTAPQASPFFIA